MLTNTKDSFVKCGILCDLGLGQSRNWEVLDDLQHLDLSAVPGSSMDLSIPGICEGYLMKRRKYPLKGWHKVSTGSERLHIINIITLIHGCSTRRHLISTYHLTVIRPFQRYFLLEKGILKYSKTQQDVSDEEKNSFLAPQA